MIATSPPPADDPPVLYRCSARVECSKRRMFAGILSVRTVFCNDAGFSCLEQSGEVLAMLACSGCGASAGYFRCGGRSASDSTSSRVPRVSGRICKGEEGWKEREG